MAKGYVERRTWFSNTTRFFFGFARKCEVRHDGRRLEASKFTVIKPAVKDGLLVFEVLLITCHA